MTSPIGVFLMDDHEIVRDAVRALLESSGEIDVVGEAATAHDALARIPAVRPDVAVLDVRMPDGNGIEVGRDIRSALGTSCLIFTSFGDDEALFASIMAGAAGYVLKQVRENQLVAAVRRAAAGESLLEPAVTAHVLRRLRRPADDDERLRALVPRERRILHLIADGLTNRQIANDMNLAETTVRTEVSNLLSRLDVVRRSESVGSASELLRSG